ncbi:MAG: hypothetical protein OEZ06_31230 [Myxococcales bacterium]|nr:hypothetical protein [Myxococcales bacterium]
MLAAQMLMMKFNRSALSAVGHGAAVKFLGNALGVFDSALLIFVGWLLGPEPLGGYVLATTYVAMVLRASVLGLDKGLLRHVP